MNELYHYGVKGQKWGVRRYQNKDGSLTSLGKKRCSKSIDINSIDRKALIKLLDSGKDFVVSKGSEVYRSTNYNKEKIAGKRYVSLRADDIGVYNHFVSETYDNNALYDITYSTNKKMLVGGERTQAEILQEMYGKKFDKKFENRGVVEKGWVNKDAMKKPISEMTDKEFQTYMYYNPFGHDRDILNKPITNLDTKKFLDELSKKGYDAVVDMLDYSIGYSDAPMIVLKSEDVLKEKSYKKIY